MFIRPAGGTIDEIADAIELTALLFGRALSVPALEATAGEHGLDTYDVGRAVSAMQRRASIIGQAYPFEVTTISVTRTAETSLYDLMLLYSHPESPSRIERLARTADDFEDVTAALTGSLFGERGRAVVFAHRMGSGRPVDFSGAVKWLADQVGVKVGAGYRPPRRKDGGVDVCAWLDFGDARAGRPLLLIQCTVREDASTKGGDVDLRLWSSWLAMDSPPLSALAVPHVINGQRWDSLADQTLVLDRIRLASLDRGDAPDELLQRCARELLGARQKDWT